MQASFYAISIDNCCGNKFWPIISDAVAISGHFRLLFTCVIVAKQAIYWPRLEIGNPLSLQ